MIDISKKAHQIAKLLDRLEPGKYEIHLLKPTGGAGSYWEINIRQIHSADGSPLTDMTRMVFGDVPIRRPVYPDRYGSTNNTEPEFLK